MRKCPGSGAASPTHLVRFRVRVRVRVRVRLRLWLWLRPRLRARVRVVDTVLVGRTARCRRRGTWGYGRRRPLFEGVRKRRGWCVDQAVTI